MTVKIAFSAQDVPSSPGIYVFRNTAGEVIYVGKAKSLRKRLSTYFQPSRVRCADPKLRALIHSIAQYECHPVASEAEALLLESRLIKEYHPRYNVDLRDDKRFLHICIDTTEVFPRLRLVRIRKDDGRLYFGPFPQAKVLRQTLDFLSRRFGLRTCPGRSPDEEDYRHCMDRRLRYCKCPCIGKISPDEYGERVQGAIDVLNGKDTCLIDELNGQMREAAQNLQFERAASLRDMVDNLRSVCDPSRRVFTRATLQIPSFSPAEAVQHLAEELGLQKRPDHIECFDMSTISGHFAVGAMVVFRGGQPSRQDYRRFRIRRAESTDDTGMMKEVLERRYGRLVSEGVSPPDLIIVDGGRGQLSAAIAALAASTIGPIPVLGLAKKQEEIILPGRRDSVVLPRHNPALRLLQSVRDEAHRFANSYNRELRRKRIADSVLSEIPGIGPTRRTQLLKAFGSVRKLAESSVAEITERVPGIGTELAGQIHDFLGRYDRHTRHTIHD